MKLFLTKKANSFLEKLDKTNEYDCKILKKAIDNIEDNLFNSKKLKGEFKGFNRVKRGNYRIVFHIDKQEKIISALKLVKEEMYINNILK